MKLIDIKKVYPGKFLTYYVASYLNEENKVKNYEMISRNKDLDINNFGEHTPVGVGVIATSLDGEKILLQQEFRMACNQWVYNFATGLIDENETAIDAAKRELWEETGVNLVAIDEVLPPSYASSPTSDEVMVIVYGKANGEIGKSTSADEEVKCKWYTKEEIRTLFKEKALMSVRTQIILHNWINTK